MPGRTNVTDVLFPDDNIFNDDYERDVVASMEDHRNVILDYFATAIIFRGLAIMNGTNPNTFKVTAGRGADINGYRVIVPLDVDNIANVDATGVFNYIAIRHNWAYSAARLPAKAGAVTYSSIRADDYDININLVQQAEVGGWILLGYAYKSLGVWYYVTTVPTFRSRGVRLAAWEKSFGYDGPVPVATNDMYHHGVQGARVHPGHVVLVDRLQASVVQAPVGAAIDFQMRINGAIPGWAPFVSIPIGSNYAVADLGLLATEIIPTDFTDIRVTGNIGLTGGGNCYANVSGTVIAA